MVRNAAVHRQRAAGERAILQKRGVARDCDSLSAKAGSEPVGKPGRAGAVGNRHHARATPLAAMASRHIAGCT